MIAREWRFIMGKTPHLPLAQTDHERLVNLLYEYISVVCYQPPTLRNASGQDDYRVLRCGLFPLAASSAAARPLEKSLRTTPGGAPLLGGDATAYHQLQLF
jgi:hypothetical protein